jgi:glycerol-3-phosphate dehydrogenase (NAD(P)+)
VTKKIAVLGAGSWGTALAVSLDRKGYTVTLWGRDGHQLDIMKESGENVRYLPGVALGPTLRLTNDLEAAVKSAGLIVAAVPSQSFRDVMTQIAPIAVKGTILVNVAKGLEQDTHMRLSEIAHIFVPDLPFAVLSGPSHAEEVGNRMPTTLVAASEISRIAEQVQDVFMSERLRIYTNPDVVGVELGGALKNIIALGAGISDGMGYGDNAKAAMMTRGITEISRLGIRMGANASTFFGLSGIGDLIVTCTSIHSRNRRCGILIGQGVKPDEAIRQIGMVVEGVYTAQAAYALAYEFDVEMPITEQIYRVINNETGAKEAVQSLMSRGKKHEQEEIL